MLSSRINAIRGIEDFDLIVRNVRIVNVFNDSVLLGDIGIVGGVIVYVGEMDFQHSAKREIDGEGRFALPGFVDSHMHLESSMLIPAHFAQIALSMGTTCVAADPHEIANVLGYEGVKALMTAAQGLPLRVLMMAPSTIPSSPGFEDSGYDVDAAEMSRLLDLPGVHGLGEVMDFNGVADGEARILSIIERASERGCLMDGHAALLTGRRLQAFKAAGIDSDHTLFTAEKLLEELSLGFTSQVQGAMLSEEMVAAMNEAPLQDRICLVTDDVPLSRLMHNGHLNYVVTRAIELGLEPIRAIRFATINAATRLRQYDIGAIAPGLRADIQLVEDIRKPLPSLVLSGGETVYEQGAAAKEIESAEIPESLRGPMRITPRAVAEFAIECDAPSGAAGGYATINIIGQDGKTFRTKKLQKELPWHVCENGRAVVDTSGYMKMAVFNRYGKNQRGLALIDGMAEFRGAVALTYGHDAHNLSVFGSNDADMTLAANTVIESQGGICTVIDGVVSTLIPLPLAGLMCEIKPTKLLAQIDAFLADCKRMGVAHEDPQSFFTIMPLAVSPEIKCTDRGLLDVARKAFIPLVESVRGN